MTAAMATDLWAWSRMRIAQRHWFKYKDLKSLELAKKLEREVDRWIDRETGSGPGPGRPCLTGRKAVNDVLDTPEGRQFAAALTSRSPGWVEMRIEATHGLHCGCGSVRSDRSFTLPTGTVVVVSPDVVDLVIKNVARNAGADKIVGRETIFR